jgi:N-acetylmuramoyl-L-alanine amidase
MRAPRELRGNYAPALKSDKGSPIRYAVGVRSPTAALRPSCGRDVDAVTRGLPRAACAHALLLLVALGCDAEHTDALAAGARDGVDDARHSSAEGSAEQQSAEALSEAQVKSWAERASAAARPATLEQVAVYGAEEVGGRQSSGRDARVVLRFDGVAVYRRGELAADAALPRRLVLDLDGVRIGQGVPAALAVGAGGLSRVRTFVLDQDHTRVSFDVGAHTESRLFFLSDPYRVVMDFRGEPSAKEALALQRPRLQIVLDPGHGGDQPGAKGPDGLRESSIALSIARKVRHALLRELPGVRVIMTRDDNRFVSLEERAAIANAIDADLFVSIHLDASPSPQDPGGVSAYVLDTTDDASALSLAARENGTNAEGVTQLQVILASLYRKEQVQRSLALAESVQRGALRGGRKLLPELNDRGVQRALFYVLVGARMPAVLLEASFITRPDEARALATDEYRQALADGIAEGIVRYADRTEARK